MRVRDSGFVPVASNLARPRTSDGVALRGELVDTLRENTDVPVVLVTGPPGYGKTTLLMQWDDEDERPFTWLSLDADCNDPTVLVTYLMLALQRLNSPDTGVLQALASHEGLSSVLLPRLGRTLAHQTEPFVIVIDRVEVLHDTAGLDVLSAMAEHIDDGSQLVLAARTPPDLPWSRLLAERRLLTIGPSELRLRPAEARAVFAGYGVAMSDDELTELLERTEGWPAGVYLAAVGAAHKHEAAGRVTEWSDTAVHEYLRDDLLADLSPERQRFLVRTSVLSAMCAPLCDAVLESSDSADVLAELERSNLFVVALHDQDGWCRYHRMFAQVLRKELTAEDPGVVAKLHARASRWLEAAGDIDQAILHAQEAHEVDRAAHLVCSNATRYLASGRVTTVQRWLDDFTAEEVVGHAELAVIAAWCALETGRPVDHWINAAEHGLFDATSIGEDRYVAAALALLRAQRGRGTVEKVADDADRAAELQLPGDPWHPYTEYLQAVALLLRGEVDDARAALQTTERLTATLDLPSHQALCLAQLAVVCSETADWGRALELSDQASEILVTRDIADSPTVSLVLCMASMAAAKRGQADDARHLTHRAMRLIAVVNQCPVWLATETRYLLARSHLLLGDTPAARVLLSEAQTQLHAIPDALWLRERLAEAWTIVENYPLATGIGPSALTSAEMKVLQLLPTHLSFEQLGRRLGVSRNTVKTQAIAAYRKLGVSSRTEAVERAKSLGMLLSSPTQLATLPPVGLGGDEVPYVTLPSPRDGDGDE